MIADQELHFYQDSTSHLNAKIYGGWLNIESVVYERDGIHWSCESHYVFTPPQTEKIFKAITLEKFIELGRTKHILGLYRFWERLGIKPQAYMI